MNRSTSVSRQYAPLRICADVCFYFFAVSLFSFSIQETFSDGNGVHRVGTNLIAPWAFQLAILVASCFALGFLIVRVENRGLRFLLSLLPGLSFLMSPFEQILLIHAVAWAYYVVVMTIGRFQVFLDEYRRRAKVMLIVAMLMGFCLIIFHFGTNSWQSDTLFGGETYGLLYFLLTVLSLRGMRLDYGTTRRMRAADGAFAVVLPMALVAVFFLLRSVVPVITFLISRVMPVLAWITRRLFFLENEPSIEKVTEEELEAAAEEESLLLTEGNDQSPGMEMASGADYRFSVSHRTTLFLMIAFFAAALVLIAIRLIRSRQKGSGQTQNASERIERVPFVGGLLRRRSGEPIQPQPVRQIRRIYRSYLQRVRALCGKIAPSDTSEDVLKFSSPYLDLPENQRLRELYLAARYGDPKGVTSEQVGEARRCLSAIEAAKPLAPEQPPARRAR